MAAAAAGGNVKLIGAWPSPYVMRPRIALNLKGVEYEFLQESFTGKSELLLKSNPVYKKIPVLLHNGRSISESMIIVEYIDDDVWAHSSVLPSDPYERAAARFWAHYIDDKSVRNGPSLRSHDAIRDVILRFRSKPPPSFQIPVYANKSTIPQKQSHKPILEREEERKMAAGGDDVKLIGSWPSPYVIRARIALNLKGVDYEFLQENLEIFFSGGKSELLLKSNPVYKKVPVLLHNGRAISESMIIVEYIDQVWPHSSVLPSDPYERAVARFWAHYIDDKLYPAVRATRMGPTEEARAEPAAAVLAALQLLEEAFEKSSKGKGFFGGEGIGYLDIALGSTLGWLKAVGKMFGTEFLDTEKTPLLAAWAERFCADAAVKEVMPETDKLVEFANVRRAKFSSGPAPGK